jgi:hypothetical protein
MMRGNEGHCFCSIGRGRFTSRIIHRILYRKIAKPNDENYTHGTVNRRQHNHLTLWHQTCLIRLQHFASIRTAISEVSMADGM